MGHEDPRLVSAALFSSCLGTGSQHRPQIWPDHTPCHRHSPAGNASSLHLLHPPDVPEPLQRASFPPRDFSSRFRAALIQHLLDAAKPSGG